MAAIVRAERNGGISRARKPGASPLRRSIGAFFVTFVAMLAQVMPLGQAIGLLSLCGYLVTIVATLLLPETRGIALSAGADSLGHPARLTEASR